MSLYSPFVSLDNPTKAPYNFYTENDPDFQQDIDENEPQQIETVYIERKFLNNHNYKKIKVFEEDVTKFEDDEITINVANYYLDFIIWKEYVSRVLFLPQSVLRKFSKSPLSALKKVKDLINDSDPNQINFILTLHEDKYNKNSKSLILGCGIQQQSQEDETSQIIVFKENESLSDSEMDAVIDLRKLVSKMTDREVNKENMPSRVQLVQKHTQLSIETDSDNPNCSSTNLDLYDLLILALTVLYDLDSLSKPPTSLTPFDLYPLEPQHQDALTDQIRDLLYFLYDYKFFERFNSVNESSIIMKRVPQLVKIEDNMSSSTESEYDQYEDEEEIQINQDFEEEMKIIDQQQEQLSIKPEPEPQRPEQSHSQRNLCTDKKVRQLSTIVEDEHEQSLTLSFDITPNGQQMPSLTFNQKSHHQKELSKVIQLQKCDYDPNYKASSNGTQTTREISTFKIELKPNSKKADNIKSKEFQEIIKDDPSSQCQIEILEIDAPSKLDPIQQCFPPNDSPLLKQIFTTSLVFNTWTQASLANTFLITTKSQSSQIICIEEPQQVVRKTKNQKKIGQMLKLKTQNDEKNQEVISNGNEEKEGEVKNQRYDKKIQLEMQEQNISQRDLVIKGQNMMIIESSSCEIHKEVHESDLTISNQGDSYFMSSPSKQMESLQQTRQNQQSVFSYNQEQSKKSSLEFQEFLDNEFQNIKTPELNKQVQQETQNSLLSSMNTFVLIDNNDRKSIFELPSAFCDLTNKSLRQTSQNTSAQKKIAFKVKKPIQILDSNQTTIENSRQSTQQIPVKVDTERKTRILMNIKNGKFSFKTKRPLQSGRVKYMQGCQPCSTDSVDFDASNKSQQLNQQHCNRYSLGTSNTRESILRGSSLTGTTISQRIKDDSSVIAGVSCSQSNDQCSICQGTNWNPKYNMPCQQCVDTPMLSARRQKYRESRSRSRGANKDMPRQMLA